MNTIEAIWVDDTITCHIDGHLIDYLFNPLEFVVPIRDGMNLFFFTCSCGIPECADWFEGFKIRVDEKSVTWVLLEDDKSRIKPKYTFDRAVYEALQNEVIKMLHEMAIQRSQKQICDDDEFGEFFMGFSNTRSLEKSLALNIEWAEKYK